MGSHTWVRDEKKGKGGKTFAVGVAAVLPTAPPPAKKRKLVWQRDPAEPVPETAAAKEKAAAAEKEAAAEKKRQEVEALRRQIAERKAELDAAKAAAKEAVAADEEAKEAEREQRKRKLNAGFAAAFSAAKDAAAADIAASKAPVTFANQAEVDRVLAAGSDYGVLRLAPGADAASVRRRYREMAVQLHPDKCKVSRSGDAFHRLVKAYQQLVKYAK
jgi:hypothetical protein